MERAIVIAAQPLVLVAVGVEAIAVAFHTPWCWIALRGRRVVPGSSVRVRRYSSAVTTNADRALEVCRDRVARSAETRATIGSIWNEYIGQVPRRFVLKAGRDDSHRIVAVETFDRMPVRLSTLFGEWLLSAPVES